MGGPGFSLSQSVTGWLDCGTGTMGWDCAIVGAMGEGALHGVGPEKAT